MLLLSLSAWRELSAFFEYRWTRRGASRSRSERTAAIISCGDMTAVKWAILQPKARVR